MAATNNVLSTRGGGSSESQEVAAQLGAWLAEHCDDLVVQLQLVLRASMFSNRMEMRPARLGHIAAEQVRALMEYVARPDRAVALRNGQQFCRAGLGEESILGLARVTRRFLLNGLPESLRYQALELVEDYQSAVAQSFIAAQTALTLEEQERIRAAIQHAVNRYAIQIDVAADIARAATSILELDVLLQTAVELIHNRFELYYVAVFLADAGRRWAYLQASAGVIDQADQRRGHRLKIGGDSLVGWCVAHGEPRVALDVSARNLSCDPPLLTASHSEMVLPLRSRGKVIGAIAIQSQKVSVFSGQDLAVINIVADQLANAIINASLYEQLRQELLDRERTAHELREARDAAEDASRAKSTFLANMGHELRTPLTEILGYSELLQLEAQQLASASLVADLAKIQTAGKHLLSIINDILDLSKIESGKMQVFAESFNLATLLAEVALAAGPLIKKNRNVLVLDPPESACTLHSDLIRIRQVLLNLLGNAAKFTETGTITIRTALERRDGQTWVAISIADTGIGIGREQLGQIFQEFIQVDASLTRRYGGTGLGLALSRRLCQLLGGTIEVSSELGVGSTFTVRFPSLLQGSGVQRAFSGAATNGSIEYRLPHDSIASL